MKKTIAIKDKERLAAVLKQNLLRRKQKNEEASKRNSIIILGSSNSEGKTLEAIQNNFSNEIPIIDLNKKHISYFDYQHKNSMDDFIPLIKEIIKYDLFIIATPVYWYSMSAQMKVFFDRISELLTIETELGRKLKGKRMFILCTYGTSMPLDFESSFIQTCKYLSINYEGCCYLYTGAEEELAKTNLKQLEKIKDIL